MRKYALVRSSVVRDGLELVNVCLWGDHLNKARVQCAAVFSSRLLSIPLCCLIGAWMLLAVLNPSVEALDQESTLVVS